MTNKKSMGLHWDVLLITLFISIGILLFSANNTSIPKVGEFSINMIKAFEKNSNVHNSVKEIMKHLNKKSSITYENHAIFGLDSYCNSGAGTDDTGYKTRLIEDDRSFDPIDTITKRDPIKCYAEESEMMKYYEEAFEIEYQDFKLKDLGKLNLDFSAVNYKPEVVNEGGIGNPNYFIKLITANGFALPITMEDGKNIGSFAIKPNFKLEVPNPPNKPFDDTEICIFARVCGATCHDVLERNPGSNFKLKEDVPAFGCDAYFNCITPLDQFREVFLCEKENDGEPDNPLLCRRQCLPFCSVGSGRVEDSDTSTVCKLYECDDYFDCNSVSTCGCPDPSANTLDQACTKTTATGCGTLDCDNDDDYEAANSVTTHCLSRICDKYGTPCSTTSVCSCSGSNNACVGECYCNPGGWEDIPGESCGADTPDSQDCDWNEIPQKREYNPSTCSSPDYRCKAQPLQVCPCIPETPCAQLGCGQTDSCDTYCGDCCVGESGDCSEEDLCCEGLSCNEVLPYVFRCES